MTSTISQPIPRLAVGLLHYPILNQKKGVVATNITNFDIHDIARAARVFGAEKYFLIHPMREQLMFVERILDHWRTGEGSKYNIFRKRALDDVHVAETLEQALAQWNPGGEVLTIGTHARPVPGTEFYSIADLRHQMWDQKKSVFLLFGTGFGMTEEYMSGLSGILESIRGAPPDDFRHLSVRSAVSIYLDRLMGPW